MSWFGNTFTFLSGNATQPITGLNPGIVLSGTEANGQYVAIREIAGALWFIQNADYDGTTFRQQVVTLPSFAMVRTANGSTSYFTAAAVGGVVTTPPIAFLPVTDFYSLTRFVANGTFTTPADSTGNTIYRYRLLGGGGGGGGAAGSGAAGAGGGAGGYAEGFFTSVVALVGIAVVVGAAGAAGSAAGGGGGTGGSSSITVGGVATTVSGGVGGGGSTSTIPNEVLGGVGGTLTAGAPTISFAGGQGSPGFGVNPASINIAGGGAGSMFGGGGPGAANGVGVAASSPGAGGGGAGNTGGSAGGSGAAGIVIIERMTP